MGIIENIVIVIQKYHIYLIKVLPDDRIGSMYNVLAVFEGKILKWILP